VGSRFTRGSGTSQAAAVTSGFVADLIQRFPTATPDQIKALVTWSGQQIHVPAGLNDGNGIISGTRALKRTSLFTSVQRFVPSSGLGSLEAARGSVHVLMDGVALTGEQDIFGSTWNGQRWSQASWNGTSWNGGLWNGQRWSGDSWDGARWSNALWDGVDWTGQRWSGQRWSDQVWDGQRWSGTTWSGARWSSGVWDGARWSDSSWSGARWSATAFADGSWS